DRFAAYADLRKLDAWRVQSLTPARWAASIELLRGLVTPPAATDGVPYETAMRWRGDAAAVDGFYSGVDEAMRFLPVRPLPLEEFWRTASAVLRLTPLRTADRRRDAVHVLSAYEARQWELPVVFVCGLNEKVFPRAHAQNPVIPDAVRVRLKRAGIHLRTSGE